MSRLDEITISTLGVHCDQGRTLATLPMDDALWLIAELRRVRTALTGTQDAEARLLLVLDKSQDRVRELETACGTAWNCVQDELLSQAEDVLRKALAAGEAPVDDETFERMMREGGWSKVWEAG